MAVFMSPRTSYVLGRFGTHSRMAWLVSWILLGGLLFTFLGWASVDEDSKKWRPGSVTLSVLAGGSLLSKKGRKTLSRVCGETFYGTLHSFTGVCSSNYDDEVGPGGPVRESD